MISSVINFFQDGGVFMYPIVVVFAIGAAIAIERWIYLTKASISNKALWKQVTPYIKAGKFTEAVSLTAKSKAAVATILGYGLKRSATAKRRDDIEKAMEESLMEVMPRLEKRTHYLATFANIATLLGLLGTIFGLTAAFAAVGAADPSQRSAFLAAGISQALNTTAFGLMIAVPAMIAHAFLVGKVEGIVEQVDEVSVRLVRVMTGKTEQF